MENKVEDYNYDIYDDWFCGLTPEEYKQASKEHFEQLNHLNKVDEFETNNLLERCEDSIFSRCLVTDKQAEMLYHTILYWRDKALAYDEEVY